jgi:hypothetical protein
MPNLDLTGSGPLCRAKQLLLQAFVNLDVLSMHNPGLS